MPPGPGIIAPSGNAAMINSQPIRFFRMNQTHVETGDGRGDGAVVAAADVFSGWPIAAGVFSASCDIVSCCGADILACHRTRYAGADSHATPFWTAEDRHP